MKINLKLKKENTVESVQHDVEKLSLLQFSQAMKVINEIITLVSKEPALEGLMNGLMDNEETEDMDGDKKFLVYLADSFETLLLHIPEQVIRLLAVLSDIDHDTLQNQALEDVFDVYDAVLEVNDIEKLFKRAKKSLAVTKTKAAFLNKVQQATAQLA